MKQRLSERHLGFGLAHGASLSYERARTRIGTVHFGPGAFHRAHQAFYVDRLLRDDPAWAISAVSLRSASVRDALASQDGLYTLVELDAHPTARVIGSIRELLVAIEEPAAVRARLSHPETSLVTTTVTEKGYCLDAGVRLDLDHPDIRHDLGGCEAPRSVIGWLVEGLRLRRERDLPPFLVVCCDNVANNGKILGDAVRTFAEQVDPALADWIEARARFPRVVVDSITPATDEALRRQAQEMTGLYDEWPVQRERYAQWVIEETDFPRQPDWESVGVTLSRDVGHFERAKLRMLNAAHSTLAYVGCLLGLETVHQAMARPELKAFIETLLAQDIEPLLADRHAHDLTAYRRSTLQRFENPAIRHRLAQIACDGSQKLPVRIFPSLCEALQRGRSVARLAVPVAAWMHFIRAETLAGRQVTDPLQSSLSGWAVQSRGEAIVDVPHFLALPKLFPESLRQDERLRSALIAAYHLIMREGPLAAAALSESSLVRGCA